MILMKIGTQAEKNMLSSAITKAEVSVNSKTAAAKFHQNWWIIAHFIACT
jgi:hypothetical protein